ncbi:MAG: hypothetical protein IKC89_03150 [Lentisphaeria bacterium]|nr:hypothetical protein [Lentisphaeria bacterium]
MKKFGVYSIVCLTAAVFCGCGKPHRTPPLERMELAAKFFRNIEENRSEQVIRQGRKLQMLMPDSTYISSLVALQEANYSIGEAQKEIERGQINKALEIIREGRRKHSGNRTFSQVYLKVFQLRNAEKLFRAMPRAKNSSGMRGARIALRSGLSLNITPELKKYLSDYELQGAALAAREKARTMAAERAARDAALKAKAEERKRKDKEARFARETAKKAAEGERLRRENRFPEQAPAQKTEPEAKPKPKPEK